MTHAELTQSVIKVISELLGIDADKISPQSHLRNELHADDLDKVEIVMELEEEFDIVIPDGAEDSMHTVDDCIAHLRGHLCEESL